MIAVPYGQVVVFLVLSVVIGVLAAILPARRAARLDVLGRDLHRVRPPAPRCGRRVRDRHLSRYSPEGGRDACRMPTLHAVDDVAVAIDGRLKHVVVREYVRDLVAGHAPGSPAPSERELVHRFGVARMTVRQALDALVTEGLLERIPGPRHLRRAPATRRHQDHRLHRGDDAARPARRVADPAGASRAGRPRRGPSPQPDRGRRRHPLAPAAPRRRRARSASRTPTSTRCCCPGSSRPACPPACTTRSTPAGCARPGSRTPSPPTPPPPTSPRCSRSPAAAVVLRHSRRGMVGDKVVEVSRSVYRADRFTMWIQLGDDSEP